MPFPPTHPALQRALADRGYDEPTSVQVAVLQPDMTDQDLLVSAQTGSGKTVAYGLAFATTLLGESPRFGIAAEPLALIIAPTRELALQIQSELGWLYQHTDARVVSCVGGMDPRREQRALAAGSHIVVGTPGRLRDHLERGQIDLSKLRVAVLDEADEMLDLGFREDLQFILDATPPSRRTLLFSATIAKEIGGLARKYQREAKRIDTVARNQPHGDIEYRAVKLAPNDIEHALVNILRFVDVRGSLVFCATREAVHRLHGRLLERGFACVALSGEMSQTDRTQALQALRDGRAQVCIATDVAARGLDLPDLDLVIHVDLPTNREMLLHRSGRTGRAGRKGICMLMVPYTRRRRAEQLLASAHIEAIWQTPPTADQIRARDQERLLNDPLLSEPPLEEEAALARLLLASCPPETIAAALIRLYRAKLPAPEDLFDDRGAMAAHDPQARDSQGRRAPPRAREREHESDVEMSWFRAAVGRNNNADPKWLVPLICRLGHVTKKEIGVIRIFDRETKFEIATEFAARFTVAVMESEEHEIRIEPSSPGNVPRPHGGPARAPGKPPRRGAPAGGKPGFDKSGGKPRFHKKK